jgi:D-methionine transport system ATP-binding protein
LGAQIIFEQVSLQATVGTDSILRHLSFSLNAGSCVAIVGPSGAGKTSLLRLLNRLIEPSSGQIWFEDKALSTWPVIPLRQKIGLVLQESNLLNMKVADALSYPLLLQGMSPDQAMRQVQPWLERLKIPSDWLHKTELELSLGQRQRVALARALLNSPTVLLLDEPTSSQDFGYAQWLMGYLKTLAQETQMTILMVNHQLDLLENWATHALYLEAGQIQQIISPPQAIPWQPIRQAIIDFNQSHAQEWGQDDL